MAAEEGKRVLILERRNHIAGNMYDEYDENGFLIQKYGPHIFHTDEEWIVKFLTRFAQWLPFKLFYGVQLDGKCIPAPFGFKAIDLLYAEEEAADLKRRLKASYPDRDGVPILDLLENPDKKIAAFAEMLYRKNYQPYAAKQWALEPRQLDPSVIARMPVILSDRTNYFNTEYEMIPKEGFSSFFKAMLQHEKIDIQLNTDARDLLQFDMEQGICMMNSERLTVPVVYTGALEDLFSCEDSPLPYRSLHFDYQTMEKDSYQPMFLVTYPQTYDYLRTTEFSKLMPKSPKGKTVVAFEYSVPYDKHAKKGNQPYYPILTKENIAQNNRYLAGLGKIPNVFPCGRLADYKYYNMDQVVIRAFDVFHQIQDSFWKVETCGE